MNDIYLQGIILVIFLFCSYRDIKERRIPNIYLIRGTSIRVLLLISEVATEGAEAIPRLLVKTLFCLLFIGIGILLQKMTRDGIGMGDIKLIALMLLYLDVDLWFHSILWGMVFGIAIAVFVKAENKEEKRIPLAPALTMGLILVLFMGI